jgi:eukaryotic-like serine/threonine-protein kinase
MTIQTLGHYRVIQKLSEGGWGVVYLAHDERLDRSVALKILSAGTLADETARKRFRKEALTLAKLNHPNIEGVFDFDTQDGVDYLVVEYVSGGTLAGRISAGQFAEKEVARLGAQVAAALDDAHERGIIHRDLKPDNIAITAKGQLKVLDFGLAKLFDPSSGPLKAETLTQSVEGEHVAGTLPYMAPEQLRGEHIDLRSDIYGLGVVLYEMATRQRPFRDHSVPRLFEAILHEPPVPPRALNPHISAEMERIILKCLEKDPEQRYQSAKEAGVDLRRLASPVEAKSSSLNDEVRKRPRRWMLGAGVGVAALALLVISVSANLDGIRTRWFSRGSRAIRTIAVLPLENLSHDQEQEYFVDGMTDELITDLAQIGALRVISRTSVMRYKKTKKTVPEIGRELHVDAVVEGSVFRNGNQLRVTAQLIQTPTDTSLWAKSYERDLREGLTMQDELAHAIASEIQVKLTPQEEVRLAKSRAANIGADDAYLKGRFLLQQGTEDQMREAKAYFEEAVRIDAGYAPAYAGLADYYWLTNELSPKVAMPKAKDYVQKALALDDGLADAHATLGSIEFYGDWDWPGAEHEFRRAIELSPSYAEAHRSYSDFLSEMGRHQEALVEIQTAQALDPLSETTKLGAGWTFYYAREYDRAAEQCSKVLDLDPHSASARDCVGSVDIATKAYGQAIEEYRKLAAVSGNDPLRLASLGCAYALAGRKAEAERVVAQLAAASRAHYVPPYFLGLVHAALGDANGAFAWLEKAYQQHDSYLVRLKVEPGLDPLRTDPRYETLLRRMKL